MQSAKLVGNRPGQTAFTVAAAVLLVAAALLLVLRLPAGAQANDRAVSGVTVTSPNSGGGGAGHHLGRTHRRAGRLPGHLEEVLGQVALI